MLSQADNIDTVIDLFGGSGTLSRVAKDALPNCRVIYNDFDFFTERVANVASTNALLHSFRPLLANVPCNKKIPNDIKNAILQMCANAERKCTVDYITLSASLLFSGKWVQSLDELSSQTMYNRIVKTEYDVTDFLHGLEVTHCDYKELLTEYKGKDNVVFLFDPPYLSTDVGSYSESYWKLPDYLDVLSSLKGVRYIYFTSEKSELEELSDWLDRSFGCSPLKHAVRYERRAAVNAAASYKDIMLVKL